MAVGEQDVVDADDLIEEMKDIAKREIERRHPALRADELEKRGFYLPSSSHLTVEQITFIADTIKKIQEKSL